MTNGSRSSLLGQFRILFEEGTVSGLTDAQLLERFLAGRDSGGEAAFGALVARHGPMVLGVCRRALADPDDAADAFQATFLVLVRKAGSVRVDDSLGRWLYGVSRRVAGRARSVAARRPRAEPRAIEAVEADPADPDRFELPALLDEELSRLPEPFRSALVLCDLEGLTHEEAARDLRCPVGTVKSRLARGRERLRGRLARRGLAPASWMVSPIVPPSMAEAAVRASMQMVAAGSTAGVVPASALALAEGVIKSMTGIHVKLAAAAALTFGIVGGAGVLARTQDGDKPGAATGKVAVEVPAVGDDRKDVPAGKPDPEDSLKDLAAQLRQARKRLAQATRLARDPADPAIIRTRRWVDELKAKLDEKVRLLYGEEDEADPTKAATPPASDAKVPIESRKIVFPDYVVEPPDVVVVEVLEALPGRPITGERLVRPDGKISLGFYGEVSVAGLTTTQAKEKIVLHLREFLNDDTLGLIQGDTEAGKVSAVPPARSNRVFVDVASYNSKVYYVQGDVGTPGRFPVTGNETVLDAINKAGGLTPTASQASIRLIRPAPPGSDKPTLLPVNLPAIINKGDVTTNYQIMPGDRVIVSREPEAPEDAKPEPARPADIESRLLSLEKKVDRILKALDGPTKLDGRPRP